MWGGKLCTAGGVQENTRCGWHSTTKGTMPWHLCLASVKPAGIIQVFLEKSKTIPENSIKFKTEVIFIKICCKAYTDAEMDVGKAPPTGDLVPEQAPVPPVTMLATAGIWAGGQDDQVPGLGVSSRAWGKAPTTQAD